MAAEVHIQEVRTRAQLRRFLTLPYALHAREPLWTPPLREDLERSLSAKNPLWQAGRGERTLFLALRDGAPVGRVMAHVHHASNARHGERSGFFGLLELPDDAEVAAALLDAAARVHRARGLDRLRGPYDLTITQCIGAMTHGFEEPASLGQSWNSPHVPGLLERCGFQGVYRMATFRMDDTAALDPDSLLGDKHRAWLKDPSVRMRGFDLHHFERDLLLSTELLNRSFHDNYGFVALSPDEVRFMAEPLRRVVRPELTVFLEQHGRAVGVGMFLPDLHVLFRRMGGRLWPTGWLSFLLGAPKLDAAVAQFIGVLPEFQNQGLMRIVLSELIRRTQAAGFRTLDGTWIAESNARSRAQAQAVGMREKHRLTLYERQLK